MNDLNQTLFLLINAPAHPAHFMIELAIFCAKYLILLFPLIMVIGWVKGSENTKKLFFMAGMSAVLGLIVNVIFGLVWYHPRPFAIHLGTNFLPHAPDSSFPSDHLTFIWAVAISLSLSRSTRPLGLLLVLLGLPVAWARIYLGVHYPFDMLGAFIVALAAAILCKEKAALIVEPLFRRAMTIYQRVLSLVCPKAK
ncbi:undecaprenyl-diphosphatase [Vibrio sp. S4M6]|uniref:undecaprenyl-diphosphatase n=1 Tax=Vibrio sinus TaxID=2946865 RepID=UPI00202A377F|nr:undecaprenyl-diphosphatase [Vibrio sinus]MCL9783879.1 undecaprenyl-diphosphatase [Vibrio sinus]